MKSLISFIASFLCGLFYIVLFSAAFGWLLMKLMDNPQGSSSEVPEYMEFIYGLPYWWRFLVYCSPFLVIFSVLSLVCGTDSEPASIGGGSGDPNAVSWEARDRWERKKPSPYTTTSDGSDSRWEHGRDRTDPDISSVFRTRYDSNGYPIPDDDED